VNDIVPCSHTDVGGTSFASVAPPPVTSGEKRASAKVESPWPEADDDGPEGAA
jgi:hypothetical protein